VAGFRQLAESPDFPEPMNAVVFSRDGHFLVGGGGAVHLLEIREAASPQKP
jgi:hypothetical protein